MTPKKSVPVPSTTKAIAQKILPTKLSPASTWKEVGEKAIKTSVNYFIVAYPLAGVLSGTSFNLSALTVLIYGAGAAGGSVVVNSIQKWANS